MAGIITDIPYVKVVGNTIFLHNSPPHGDKNESVVRKATIYLNECDITVKGKHFLKNFDVKLKKSFPSKRHITIVNKP